MDVVSLPAWTPSEAVDYKNCPATLSAVSIVDTRNNSAGILGELETEHLYQLNHVYVPTPASNHSVLLDGRLFAVFDCWDYSKLVQFGFRSQAMLQLAGFEAGTSLNEYLAALQAGEIRHPILASLRVRIKKISTRRPKLPPRVQRPAKMRVQSVPYEISKHWSWKLSRIRTMTHTAFRTTPSTGSSDCSRLGHHSPVSASLRSRSPTLRPRLSTT